MSAAIPAINFGASNDFAMGIEEELLLVDPATHALDHSAVDLLLRLPETPAQGAACPETYSSLVELESPVCADVADAVESLAAWRERIREAGATAIGAGLHPDGSFGDVVHFPTDRYRRIADEMRGLLARTPTCALHVHVGMPDAESAIRAYNGLRDHLPLLQALAANSPFWHGRDSGFASARSQVFRAFPTSEVPEAFSSFDEYADRVEKTVAAGGLPDYTYLWWDLRPHPALGTVEVRAMDSQSSLATVAGVAALVHALTLRAVDGHVQGESREVLMESSFRAARDGLDATIWYDDALRPVSEVAWETIQLARPYARDHGFESALEEVEKVLEDGNGAARQRIAFDRGGMRTVLAELAGETRAAGRESLSVISV